MLERIIDWAIDNRLLVVVAAALVTAAGIYSLMRAPMDAIPDLSDVQVIVYTEYPGQAPRIVEDQVTYPLTTELLAVPGASVVRGYSFFGYSFVYVLFEDGTDLYWARARVLETLSHAASRLPAGVSPSLGPDATGVGWAFMYALTSDRHDLGELRSLQDWFLKYELASVPGVSEVASIGGFVRQYQITVDPNRLRAYGIPISRIRDAVAASNADVGGRTLEVAEREFVIRGLGSIGATEDIGKIALGVDAGGAPILVKDVARLSIGPEMRRGIAEWNGEGETVGGIVVVRHGAGTLQVIRAVKERLAEIKPGLPEGVEVRIAYDRTGLIERSVSSLRQSLLQQLVIVGLVSMAFLLHFRSGLVAVVSLPVGILLAFLAMSMQGINVNIMSLGGIAVAIGTMVDASIVMVENAHRHLARGADGQGASGDEGRTAPEHWKAVAGAAREVGPTLFFALLVITVSFLPVFALEAQEGRLFKPLGLCQDLCHGRRGAAGGDAGAGVGGLSDEGPHSAGRHEASQAGRDGAWPCLVRRRSTGAADRRCGVSLQVLGAGPCLPWPCGHRGSVLEARLRVHAAALGGRSSLHADDAAGGVHHQGRGAASADRPRDCLVPGGGERVRQGGAGRDGHRSRAAVDDRDHHHPQAEGGMATGHDGGTAHRGDGRGARRAGPHQLLDHAHPNAHRHALHRHQDAGGHQDRRPGSRRARTARQGGGGGGAFASRHRRCLCRADHGRQLSRHRHRPRRHRPLRADGARRAGRDRDRHRRHEHHLGGGRAGTLSGESSLQPGTAGRPAGAAGGARAGAHRRARSARTPCRDRLCGGAAEHQERGRQAERVGVCGHPRRGRGRLCGGGASSGGGAGAASRRLHHRLEWPV